MTKKLPLYCRKCGNYLKMGSVDADKVMVYRYDSMGGSMLRLDSEFNENTGERNEAETFTCPKWKKYFLFSSGHDKIINYQQELHYL